MRKFLFHPSLRIIFSMAVLFVSCGKKEQIKSGKDVYRQEEIKPSDLEELLKKEQIVCEAGQVCPNYISKVAIYDGSRVSYCTGFLVNNSTVATAASCLPHFLRGIGQDCSRDVHFFFPATLNRPQERMNCSKVLQVSNLETRDPILWRDDLVFFELERPTLFRRSLPFNRDGLINQRSYAFWGIEQDDQQVAFIRRQDCEAIQKSYINPLASKETSPNMLFAGCALKRGNVGSPIIDSRGRVKAVVSQPIDQRIRTYLEGTGLLTVPLKQMFHATNFSCAPTVYDTDVSDERECLKDLNYATLDRLREEILMPADLFLSLKRKVEEKITNVSKFIDFGVRLIPQGDNQLIEIFPKCFKNISNWINDLNTSRNSHVFQVSLPDSSFKRVMNEFGRIEAAVATSEERSFFVQFSPKNIKANRQSTVFMWNDSSSRTFQNITDVCQ
jgi:hypothetical protein